MRGSAGHRNSGSYTIGRFALLLTDPHFLIVLILTDHHLQVVLVLTYPHFLDWYDPSVITEVLVVFPVLAEVLVVVLISSLNCDGVESGPGEAVAGEAMAAWKAAVRALSRVFLTLL